MKTKTQSRPSQRERLLALLRAKGSRGVYVYEIIAPRPDGLGIAQYNTRIKELREGGNDRPKYNIVNTEPGHFVLIEHGKREVITQTPIKLSAEKKLENFNQQLVELEQKINSETDRSVRIDLEGKFKVLKMQARMIEIGLGKRDFQGEIEQTLIQGELL